MYILTLKGESKMRNTVIVNLYGALALGSQQAQHISLGN